MAYGQYLTPRARELEPVEIRKVVDMIRGEDVIPLAAGWPNPESFPIDILDELIQRRLAERGTEMLQYGVTPGEETLRTRIGHRLRSTYGIDADAEEIMVTSGSQQGLYILARALLDDDSTAVAGAPTYVAALTAFESLTDPTYKQVPLDDDGLDLDALERVLETTSPELVYVVPTYQNPTGITMSRARRRRLVGLAHEHDFLIVEDSPYAELSFGTNPPAPIASFDRDRTIYLGTMSKILAPGFRIGWMVAPPELIETFELLKQPIDLHTSSFSQHVAAGYLQEGIIDDQIDRITELYAGKRDIALKTLRETMPDYVDWTEPHGGMFLWLTLPDRFDTEAMLVDAIDNGVAYIPGHAFYAAEPRYDTLRINFTYVDDDAVRDGIRKLAATIRQHEPDSP